MFYETKDGPRGLAEDPLNTCIAPRPIAWISTVSVDGIVNLAPYSYFTRIATSPPMVVFGSSRRGAGGAKDTITNCKETCEFVVNVVNWDLRSEMSQTSASVPPKIDEMEMVGLKGAPSRLVKPPRVGASPVNLECVVHEIIDLPSDDPDGANAMVLGRIVGVHLSDNILTEGLVDPTKLRLIGQFGGEVYVRAESVITVKRPE
jgi:flavin reductase (DIM6/NTAB) family NADH-FMN oxidoreductase RutF